MLKPVIETQGLCKTYLQQEILKNINLKIMPGSSTAIVGLSGSGKSTLLRILAGLETYDAGELTTDRELNLGFVFQDPSLLPWLSLRENILLPLKLQNKNKYAKNEIQIALEEVLNLTGLTDFTEYFPHELSGGMKMRCSLARALIFKPKILFLDEALSSLDENTREAIQTDLIKIWRNLKISILQVTHSISEALSLSERVLVLSKNTIVFEFQGQLGTVEKSFETNDYVTKIKECIRNGAP